MEIIVWIIIFGPAIILMYLMFINMIIEEWTKLKGEKNERR